MPSFFAIAVTLNTSCLVSGLLLVGQFENKHKLPPASRNKPSG